MFQRANHVTVTGGVFTVSDASQSRDLQREGQRFLQHKIAPGAFHNSAERYNPPKCHNDTRLAVLGKIMDWVTDLHKSCFFMWLYGPAGAGKSAIAQTMSEICFGAKILAASFFFCRNAPNRNVDAYFITTLVYQLMLSMPEIGPRVGKAVADDPLILSRSLEAQIKTLIVNPINETAMDEQDGPSLAQRPRFIIVDGLDECVEAASQKYILDTLFCAVQELSLPLFFLIASRPEPHIRDAFNDPLSPSTIRIALDDTYQPDADIRHFLDSRFEDIRRKHPSLPATWPSYSEMELLVQKSSGQFLYVSTVMKDLDSHDHDPSQRLNSILDLSTSGDGTPFAEIDAIYQHILESASDVDKVIDILSFIIMVEFWTKSKSSIEDFLFYRRGEVDVILSRLHSLVRIPSPQDAGMELSIWHSSLSDFLFDESRSQQFFINTRKVHSKLVGHCIRHLKMENSPLAKAPVNIHHLRSLLTISCVESDPSMQVLKDLYNFDMDTHLNFWASEDNVVGIYAHDTKRLASLIMWLKSQRHPSYPNDLFQHHLHSIDGWIFQQLETYSAEPNFDEFLAAGILTGFLSEEIFTVLGTNPVSKSGFTRERRSDPLQIYSRDREYAIFYTLIADFLLDQTRSGKYFVHGRKFANLSHFLLKFLDHDSRPAEIEKFAIELLGKALPKSAKSADLAESLFVHPLSWTPREEDNFYAEKLKAYRAIRHYSERRDLPTADTR